MFASRAWLLGGLCLVAACTRSAPQVGLASAADVAAVARTVAIFDSCARTGALDVFMGYVAEDAVALFPDMPAIVGKEALRAFYGSYYSGFKIDGHHAPIETQTIGDLVINRGEVHGTVTPKAGGQPMPIDNKYLMIFRRQGDGSLRIWRAAANQNAPAAPPAQSK